MKNAKDETGHSLRDTFAAAALQGLISEGFLKTTTPSRDVQQTPQEILAIRAFEIADAMLKARDDNGNGREE